MQVPRRHHSKVLACGVALGWLATNLLAQAQAADLSIGNGGVQFNRETTIESDFVESHGAYQSTFGVINLETNEKTPLLIEVKPADSPAPVERPSTRVNDFNTERDFLGTAQATVIKPLGRLTFRPNTRYVFYLESSFNGRPTGTVYSEDTMNPNKERQVTFTGNPTNLCADGGMILAWDDTGSALVRTRAQQDRDFDDFIVRMRDTACGGSALPPPVPSAETPPGAGIPPVTGQVPPAGGTTPPITGGGAPPFPGTAVGLGLLGVGAGVALLTGGDDDDNNDSNPPQTIAPPGQPLFPPPTIGPPTTPEGEPIPEPLTILGSGTAIGIAALMQKRRARQRQKKSNK
ncbi:PEP-CTERM sorting domain-containing protein [Phormidesmis sp. 146-20]